MRALAICLVLIASPEMAYDEWDAAMNGCATLPPMKPVTVDYKIHQVPKRALDRYCQTDKHPSGTRFAACSYPDSDDSNVWHVFVLNTAPSVDALECAIRYEKAHMPPNSWGDPSVEGPGTMVGYGLRFY